MAGDSRHGPSDAERARIIALRGLNYTQQEIADYVDFSKNTVQRVLYDAENRAKQKDDPITVFGSYVENLLEVRVSVREVRGSHHSPQSADPLHSKGDDE